ncbi:MAG: nicotinate phosphoribosyltransferase [Desulfovibrionaceae bacterium]
MILTGPWVDDGDAALFTDLYELTMVQAYFHEGMDQNATFSLFFRETDKRNYLLACGLESALRYLENLRFEPPALEYLERQGEFDREFLDWLADFRFTGDAWAMPEGSVCFPHEPLLEVEAPIAEAQLAETFLLNQFSHQTAVASKASRVVQACQGRAAVDFGARRMHGTDAGVKAARAFHIAGVNATSNVFAGYAFDLPISGTMAHSYVQAHEDEYQAFKAFSELYPDTILLVDTYDTIEAVKLVVRLAEEQGDDFSVSGIRLDSGDLVELARQSRKILDHAGLEDVSIFASGGLDEYKIQDMVRQKAPIDGFGVGTRMGVSEDEPALDTAYKLTSFAGQGRLKTSPGKRILPGRKQVFRQEQDGVAVRDVIARASEELAGQPLLRKVMENGTRLPDGENDLPAACNRAAREIDALPERLRLLEPADPPYEVAVSDELLQYQAQVVEDVAAKQSGGR